MMKTPSRTLAALSLALSLAAPAAAGLDKVVMGYSATWLDGLYPPEGYNYGAITHLCRSFVIPKDDGSLVVDAGYFDPTLYRMAKASGVKLIVSLGGQAAGAKAWLAIARDEKAMNRFFGELERLVTQNKYDGIDIDWEPSALKDEDQAAYTDFMVKLRKRFPKWFISTALIIGDYWARHVSWDKVMPTIDYLNAMTYVFAGSWTGHSAHNSNLYPPSSFSEPGGLSTHGALENLVKKYRVPKEKVNLGLHFDGAHFSTDHMGDAFAGPAKDLGEITYWQVAAYLRSGAYHAKWDEGAKVPYLERKAGGHTITYDDARSIGLKCDYVKQQGYAGVLIWVLGDDLQGGATPLLDAVAKAFGGKPAALPAPALVKHIANRKGVVAGLFKKLSDAKADLASRGPAGKAAAAAADPGKEPGFKDAAPKDLAGLRKQVGLIEVQIAAYQEKLFSAEKAMESIPAQRVKGRALAADKDLLIDDFEGAGALNKLGGRWETDMDKNGLGSLLQPMPYAASKGGSPASPGQAARIRGHWGRSVDPWPYAYLLGTLDSSGGPVDLSAFKALSFWAKGDGKTYEVIVGRESVKDSAHFRAAFKAPAAWTKVSLPLAGFAQPSWGKKVDPKLSDAKTLGFEIQASSANNEDFDLSIDQIQLVK